MKNLLSILLIWTILFVPLAHISYAQQPPQTKEEKQKQKEEEKKRKKEEEARKKAENEGERKGFWDRAKSAAGAAGNVVKDAATGKKSADPAAMILGKLFNDELPIKLDASTTYKEVPTPKNFKPIFIQPTAKNLNIQLLPGDYSFPVHAICTKDSIHVPGRGVGYKLAPLEGKQAKLLATLISRGDLAKVPHNTLQMIAWEIQSSFSYGSMPKEHQAIIDKLIPEYKESLKGDFLQKITDGYNKFVRENPNSPASTFSQTINSLNRSRTIIREEAFDYQRSQLRLYDPALGERVTPADPSQPSAWTELKPGVYTQIIIEDGWQGLNRLNVRITKEAGKQPNTNNTQSKTFNRIQPTAFLPVSYSIDSPAQIPLIFPAIAEIFGLIAVGATAAEGIRKQPNFDIGFGLIAYSVAMATQALIMSLSVQDEDENYVLVYHGSWNNATSIKINGLRFDRDGATYVSRDLAAALNAINDRYEVRYGAGMIFDSDVIKSKIPVKLFNEHFAPAERPYRGFNSKLNPTTEILLTKPIQFQIFNQYMMR